MAVNFLLLNKKNPLSFYQTTMLFQSWQNYGHTGFIITLYLASSFRGSCNSDCRNELLLSTNTSKLLSS